LAGNTAQFFDTANFRPKKIMSAHSFNVALKFYQNIGLLAPNVFIFWTTENFSIIFQEPKISGE